MNYKTELHCHSSLVSACGKISPAEIIEKYVAAGDTSLVLTEHLNSKTFKSDKYTGDPDSWKEKIDYFFAGYETLKKEAAGRLHILLGAELRIHHSEKLYYGVSDFLCYGLTKEFLYENSDILDLCFKDFSKRIRGAGILLYQAHPFRNYMCVMPPSLLDGIEVYNCNPAHDSRNDVADLWADRFGLPKISGSDIHRARYLAAGGIVTESPITTNEELLTVLRNGNYSLIREDFLNWDKTGLEQSKG